MASWKAILKGLPLTPTERGEAFYACFALGWSEAKITKYFEEAHEMGEEVLIAALRRLLRTAGPSEDSTPPKIVDILCEKTEDEEIVYEKFTFVIKNSAHFNRIVGVGCFLAPLKETCPKHHGVSSFDELEHGQTYVLRSAESSPGRIKALENYVKNEAHAGDDEFAHSMLAELKGHGFARDPVLRTDLRSHCLGTPLEQEFDVVTLDGEDKAFFGSAKHTCHGSSVLDRCLQEVAKVADRRQDIHSFSSYAEFRGRLLGCCVRADWIQDKAQDAVVNHCWRNSVGLFRRSGHAITMTTFPLSAPGYVQQIGRGFLNLAICRKLLK